MKNKNNYASLGLKALKRAAKKVVKNAKINNLKIPVWKDGKIIYENPNNIN